MSQVLKKLAKELKANDVVKIITKSSVIHQQFKNKSWQKLSRVKNFSCIFLGSLGWTKQVATNSGEDITVSS